MLIIIDYQDKSCLIINHIQFVVIKIFLFVCILIIYLIEIVQINVIVTFIVYLINKYKTISMCILHKSIKGPSAPSSKTGWKSL